jgi:protein transport protein SEC24
VVVTWTLQPSVRIPEPRCIQCSLCRNSDVLIGHVSAVSGGESFYYPNFHAPRDSLKLSEEIKRTVTRETGFQALMKVRCSNGLQVSSYHGNFLQHNSGADLEFGVIDADKAIGVLFSYDGKLESKLDAHFQSALLYTTASGERRVRCTNTVASVSEGATESMKFVDQDAVVNIIAKEGKLFYSMGVFAHHKLTYVTAATRMTERSLKDIRGALTEKTVDILAGYRRNFSGSHPPGQLVLPENLKEFSMYILGLIKTRPFKGMISQQCKCVDGAADEIVRWARNYRSKNLRDANDQIYGRHGAVTLPLP